MKIYRIPKRLALIIFDIDSTLYTNPEYAHEQVDIQLRHFANIRGIETSEARNMVEKFRREHETLHGKKISLGNALVHFGIPISESIKWREKLLEPAQYLAADTRLQKVLESLSERFSIVAVTNNPVLPARKTLEAIGVSPYFPDLIGLDTTGVSKPHEKPFLAAVQAGGAKIEECLSVGDRYDIDIALPLEMGMGGILVDGVTDVYGLPEILA
jgi:HAD superfamily hydrolase (TIGR01549 family)